MSSNLAKMAVNVSIDGHMSESIQFMALHDTGSEKTIMSKAAFDKVCKAHQDANVKMHTKNTKVKKLHDCYVQAYDGSLTEAYGTFEVTLHFLGVNGITKAYKFPVIVHEHTTHDIMLGNDFTGSNAKFMEIKNYMYLIDEYITPDLPELEDLPEQIKKCCIVYILSLIHI